VSVIACDAVWLINPYLALLLAPTAHVWLLATRSGLAARLGAPVAVGLALIPFVAALVAVAAAIDLGLEAPWTFAIMVADGQFGLPVVAACCLLAGALAGAAALAGGKARVQP
jgi:hypothetical protein